MKHFSYARDENGTLTSFRSCFHLVEFSNHIAELKGFSEAHSERKHPASGAWA